MKITVILKDLCAVVTIGLVFFGLRFVEEMKKSLMYKTVVGVTTVLAVVASGIAAYFVIRYFEKKKESKPAPLITVDHHAQHLESVYVTLASGSIPYTPHFGTVDSATSSNVITARPFGSQKYQIPIAALTLNTIITCDSVVMSRLSVKP